MTTYTANFEAQTFTSKGHDGFLVLTGRPAGLVQQEAQASVEIIKESVASAEARAIAYAGVVDDELLAESINAAKKRLVAAEKHLAAVSEIAKVQTFFWERKSLHATAHHAEKAASKFGRSQIIKLEAVA